MTSIRTDVLAQLMLGPKDQKQLLDAIEQIENPKQLSNCLYHLRQSGDVTRRDDGRYEIAPIDDSGLVGNDTRRQSKAMPIARAIAAMVPPRHMDADDTEATIKPPAAKKPIHLVRQAKPSSRRRRSEEAEQSARVRAMAPSKFLEDAHDDDAALEKEIKADLARATPAATAAGQNLVREILERAVADSQQTIDEYVTAVADPRILGPLRAARDQARAALAALDAMDATP